MKIFDITLPLSDLTPVWEGEQGVSVKRSSVQGQHSDYNVSRLEMGMHSGTHIDAPFHVDEKGETIDAIPLEKLIGPVQVIQIPTTAQEINGSCLAVLDIDPKIKRIIFKTENSRLWNKNPQKFQREFVALNTSGAEYLLALEPYLIGIDFFSVSSYYDLLQPHKLLLANQIVLLENVDLRNVQPGIYDLFCLPLKVVDTDGAPVRAILTKNQ